MTGDIEDAVLVCGVDVEKPLYGDSIAQQLVVRQTGEGKVLRLRFLRYRNIYGNGYLLDGLSYLDKLSGASPWMGLQLPALGPPIGVVVVVDVAQHEAVLRLVDNDPDVSADPDRPEVSVTRTFYFVKLQARTEWVHLKIEGCSLDGLLLVAC